MANEVLGRVRCAHCGQMATVHQQVGRNKAYYYRCYSGPYGTCGTIQCTGPGGQRYILQHAEWNEGQGPAKPEPQPTESPKGEIPPKANPQSKRGSFFKQLFAEDDA